ncbi:MAG: sugar ABC transporter ATP-binding protein [Pseudolysinimonas sp.]
MEVQPILEVVGAQLRFAGDIALSDVNFRMFPGEVHSLMGENGAGKSTLIKAITGAIRLDAGSISIDGRPVFFSTTAAAQRAGIRTVYQEIDLLPNLSVAENIMLGRESRRLGFIDWRSTRLAARDAMRRVGLDLDPDSLLSSHSLAVQQLVAIARAVSTELRILILDEPTSSLDQDEVAELFGVIRELKARGVAILFVSHFLEQVYEICDRVTVLRNGSMVGEYLTTELLRIDLVQKMLGRDFIELGAETRSTAALPESDRRVVLSAVDVSRSHRILPTSVDLIAGEVLGMAGLLGSGRTELARILSGVDATETGWIVYEGERRHFNEPRDALAAGVAYSSEDRKREGIIAELSVRENILLALQAEQGWVRRIPRRRQDELTASWIEALDIRPANPDYPAGLLSGGNQQKVMLARLLALAPRALVLDEPTRGIDVGAKVEVQRLIADLATTGMSVVFISAELEEVLRVSDRILVLRDRQAVAELDPEAVTVDMLLAIVAKADSDE